MSQTENEYADELFKHQRELEKQLAPNPRYMEEVQTELCERMRVELFDLINEVHYEHFRGYGSAMIFLTYNIIDRFLSRCNVRADQFQLLGITALQIAHKFENGVGEKLSNLASICNGVYTEKKITRAECYVLQALDYRLAWPGPSLFLERLNSATLFSGNTAGADDLNTLIKFAAEYIVEANRFNYAFVAKPPSLMAATAFFLAQSLLTSYQWTRAQEKSSEYTQSQLSPYVEELRHWMRTSKSLYQEVYRRFKLRRRMRVALLVEQRLEDHETEPARPRPGIGSNEWVREIARLAGLTSVE